MVLAGALCFQCGSRGSKWKHIEAMVQLQLPFSCVHSSSALLNQKDLHKKSCETERLGATKCPWSCQPCNSLASIPKRKRRHCTSFSCEKTCTHFWGSPFQKPWRSIISICLNIQLLVQSLKCIIKVWNRARAASLAQQTHSHHCTMSAPYCLPMVMVGMIKSLMCSVFSKFSSNRKRSQTDPSATPKWDCMRARSDCHWLKSNHTVGAEMILPYNRITMTLNMSFIFMSSSIMRVHNAFNRGSAENHGMYITETHLIILIEHQGTSCSYWLYI